VAALGELLVGAGNARLHSDALIVAQLGGAVTTASAALVDENLRSRSDDPRSHRAAEQAAAAVAAAARVAGHPEPTPIRNVHP
jgi:hypothetical protein